MGVAGNRSSKEKVRRDSQSSASNAVHAGGLKYSRLLLPQPVLGVDRPFQRPLPVQLHLQ